MRIQRAMAPTKRPGRDRGWAHLWRGLQARAVQIRQVWAGRVRDLRWRARACLFIGGSLALLVLLVFGVRLQVHRTLARRLDRWIARGSALARVERARTNNALPTLYLDLEPRAAQELAMQQVQAQRSGILLPQDVIALDAQVRVERSSSVLQRLLDRRPKPGTSAQVRLAGSRCDGVQPVDQWQPDKWSLEVQTPPGTPVLEWDAFTLRSPALRGYLDGWLYREALHEAGLLSTRTTLVNLVLNGENWGTYLLEPELEPAGAAWFESLDAEQRGRLLAHADLWAQEIPGACLRETDPGVQARRLLQENPQIRAAYVSEVARITRPEYLRALRAVSRRAFERYRSALSDEFFSAYLVAPWDVLAERQAELAARVDETTWAEADARPTLASADSRLPPLQTEAALPSIEEVLARHPFLVRSDRPGFLGVRPGDWQVTGDLILPAGVGLWSDGAFTLRFERGAVLVAHGPLILHGPEKGGIYLLPQQDHWAGVRVVDADPALPSAWHNVEVRGVRGAPGEGDLAAQAGILFYRSPVLLEHCRVLDSYAPAALSIVGASLKLYDSEFGVASDDLFQARAAQGTISRCAFHDALGAGLRLDESAVEVVDVSMLRVEGAAVDAGRKSRVEIVGLRADRVDVGVTSAGAQVHVRDVHLGHAATAGFLAHSGARLEVDTALLDDSARFIVQEGSEATLDGAPLETLAFAVDELRPPKEPSPSMSPLGVRFGPSIWLVGYQLATPERAPGETIEVILYWRAFVYLDWQYTIFMHVRNAAGETVAGWDMMPRYNTFPTTDWPLVERIDDVHIVPLPTDLPPGEYTVALGMYDWATGVRLPAYTRAGEPLAEDTVILQERVTVR